MLPSQGPIWLQGSKKFKVMMMILTSRIPTLSTRLQYNGMAKDTEPPADVCPVDEATREAWLKSKSAKPPFPGISSKESSPTCDSENINQAPPPKPGFLSRIFGSSQPAEESLSTGEKLAVDREISTIPRASPVNHAEGSQPANSEQESGVSKDGNWIYPSEKMFFEAMKRKGRAGDAADMKTVVPIHNAVNERAWKEIKEWERPWGSEQKYGPITLNFRCCLTMSHTN